MPAEDDFHSGTSVSFSVKELLAEQTGLLRQIDHKVDGKADKSDLIPIFTKLEQHTHEIGKLKDGVAEDSSIKAYRSRVWARIGGACVAAGAVSGIILAFRAH